MKIQLTKKWKQRSYSYSSDASYGHIHLECYHFLPSIAGPNRWYGAASTRLHEWIERIGPIRKSPKLAKQDAERLAVELLLDIRDGTKALMEQYGIDKDD